MSSTRSDLARAFGVDEDDDRLDVFMQRAVAKGYKPTEFVAFATGKGKQPLPVDYGPEGPPSWLAPDRAGKRAKNPIRRAGQVSEDELFPEEYEQADPVATIKGAKRELEQTPSFPQRAYRRAGAVAQGINEGLVPGGLLARAAEGFGGPTTSQYQAEDPNAVNVGRGTGMGVGAVAGPASMLGNAVSQGIARAVPATAIPATQRLLAAQATGMGLGAMESGGDFDTTMASGVAGLGGQALGEAARAGRGAIQRAVPWVGRRVRAEEAGLLPGAKSLPRGREGITRASERARDDILTRDEALTAEAQAQYRGQVDPVLEQPGSMGPVRRQLLEGGVGSRPPGAASNRRAAERPATRTVGRNREVLQDLGDDPTVGDMLQIRRQLDTEAGFGSPAPTPAQMAAREARTAVRAGIREASPTVAGADDAFTQFRRGQERRNDIMFRNEQGGRDVQLTDEALEAMPPGMRQAMRVGDEVKAAAALERLGDDSIEALRLQPYLDELAAQDPAFAQALQRLEAKKALEATRLLTLAPQVRTNLGNLVGKVPGANIAAQYGRGGASLLEKSLRAPEILGEFPPGALPLIEAARQDRKRNEQRGRRARGEK